jgi:hypothetical protein
MLLALCRTPTMTKIRRSLYAALLASVVRITHAESAFTDGDFGGASGALGGWQTSGTVRVTFTNDLINGTIDPADQSLTFDSALADYFTTGYFAVLGNNFGNTNGLPDTGIHILSRTFTLAPGSTYDVTVGLRTTLDGRAAHPDDGYCDFFTARLLGPSGFVGVLFNHVFCNGEGQYDNPNFNMAFSDLASGAYTLEFKLVEGPDFDTLNTAAGIDSVTVDVTANSPPAAVAVPVPRWATALLLLVVLCSATRARRGLPQNLRE